MLDTLRTYKGQFSYFVTGPFLDQHDANGRLLPQQGLAEPNAPRPGPEATIEILSPTGELYASTTTDENGKYSIDVNLGKRPGTQVRVRAVARRTYSGGVDLRVLPNLAATTPYEYSTPLTGDPNAQIVTINVAVPMDQGAGAFHILQALAPGFQRIRGGIGTTIPDLDVLWEPGNGALSSFSVASSGLGRMLVAGGITGNDASNQDVWDDPKLMRLLGEYYLAYFSNSVAPPGTPDDSPLVPSAAWREGFLDFFACLGRDNPEFWDTEGRGSAGRVVRYYNLESFFDSTLGTLGPGDPNVYQPVSNVGIGSRFTVAEVLWDIYDSGIHDTDGDGLTVPGNLLLHDIGTLQPGNSYPYLYSALDRFVENVAIFPTQALVALLYPEDQQLTYPAEPVDVWPTPFLDPARPNGTLAHPYDKTLPGTIDNVTPGSNPTLGIASQRHFGFVIVDPATAQVNVTPSTLRVEILNLNNQVLGAGTGTAIAPLPAGEYVLRVAPEAGAVSTAFTLQLQLFP